MDKQLANLQFQCEAAARKARGVQAAIWRLRAEEAECLAERAETCPWDTAVETLARALWARCAWGK